MYIYWFSSESGYRRRRRDDAGHNSTTTRVTYRQQPKCWHTHRPRMKVLLQMTLKATGNNSLQYGQASAGMEPTPPRLA